MEQQELDEVIEKHKKWLYGEVGERANLRGRDLRDADLRAANLRGADLRHANLRAANLWDSNLRHVNLWGADLRHANLWDSNLQGANLCGADLWHAHLRWSSRNLISEILRQSAGDSRPKREIAGLIAVSRDWCWGDFAEESQNIRPYLLEWCARTLLTVAENPEQAPDLIKSQVDDISDFIDEEE